MLEIAGALFVSKAEGDPSDHPSESHPRVVLIADSQTDPIVARIYAELAALGFMVVVVRAGEEPPTRGPLEVSAREAGAVAAIRVTQAPAGLVVWVVDRVTGKMVERAVTADDPATVAIRAVELLRASLLEVRALHPSRGEVAPDPTVAAIVEADQTPPPKPTSKPAAPRPSLQRETTLPSPARVEPTSHVVFGEGVAPAGMWSAGGLPTAAMLEVSGYVMFWPHLGLTTFVMIPLSSTTLASTEGTLLTRESLVGLGVRVALAAPDATWLPTLGIGSAGAWLHVVGQGTPPKYVGSTQDAYACVPYLRPGISVAPIRNLHFGAQLFAGVALPQIVIDTAGKTADTWGRPILGGSLGAEIVLP